MTPIGREMLHEMLHEISTSRDFGLRRLITVDRRPQRASSCCACLCRVRADAQTISCALRGCQAEMNAGVHPRSRSAFQAIVMWSRLKSRPLRAFQACTRSTIASRSPAGVPSSVITQ